MKKLWNKIKEKIQDYIKTNRALKKEVKELNKIIVDLAVHINNIIDEKNEYKNKCMEYQRNKRRKEVKK